MTDAVVTLHKFSSVTDNFDGICLWTVGVNMHVHGVENTHSQDSGRAVRTQGVGIPDLLAVSTLDPLIPALIRCVCAPGLFRMVADPRPYLSIEEIVQSLKIGSHRLGQPVFVSSAPIALTEGLLKDGEMFCITSAVLDQNGTEGHVECEVLHQVPKRCFRLDVSQQGEFTECDDDQFYTLKELAEWKIPRTRRRTVTAVKDFPVKDLIHSNQLENVSGELALTPVYELQAVMACKNSSFYSSYLKFQKVHNFLKIKHPNRQIHQC